MLELHGVHIPSDQPYSIVLIENQTHNLNRRSYAIEGYDGERAEIFLSGGYKYCNEQFTILRERIAEAGMYVQEVGSFSYYVPRHMLVNYLPSVVADKIVQNLGRYPLIKVEKSRIGHRMAAYNRKSNGGYNAKDPYK